MKLDLSLIKKITSGAVRVTEGEKCISLRRFNEAEEQIYADRNVLFRALSTAGIEMEFKTDANFLKLKVNTNPGSSRSYFSHDIFVNDKLLGHIKNFDNQRNMGLVAGEFQLGEYSGEFDLGEGDKTVRIVFPWSVASDILEMELADVTYIEKVIKEKTMLMYGDSITHGYDAAFPSNTYAYKIARSLGAEAFVKAIGGECYLARLAQIKNDISPDYITVAYGTNDWNSREREVFEKECEGFLRALVENYPESKIFVFTPIWRAECDKITNFGAFDDMKECIYDICKKVGHVVCISGRHFVPEDENNYADLRLHPNDQGFEYYVDNLQIELKKYI